MPTIFDTLIRHIAVDVVAIFDQNFNQLFSLARPIKATVKETAKVMEHPVETGAIITDHRIILPIEIELSFILSGDEYVSTYQSIRQYYLNSTLLTVQTRTGTYDNQLISAMPHEETPDQYDAVSLAVSLKQVQFVSPQFNVKPRRPRNSTNTGRGTLQPNPPTPSQRTAAQQIFRS